MSNHFRIGACLAALISAGRVAGGQTTLAVKDLGPIVARSQQTFGLILGLRELPGGKVLVDDARARRMLLLDSTLGRATIVLDSASGGPNYYGPQPIPLITYLGDSSLVVDGVARALLLIGPTGELVRTLAAPNARDLPALAGSAAAVDRRGRLVYRVVPSASSLTLTSPGKAGEKASPMSLANPLPIVRADFETRVIDTIGRLAPMIPTRSQSSQSADGQFTVRTFINPVPVGDDWAMLSTGAIAIVRGHDYHVDWIDPDGSTRSTPKLPFDWKRLSDTEKQRLVDSARATAEENAGSSSRSGRAAAASGGGDGGNGNGTGGRGIAGSRAGGGVHLEFVGVPLSEISDFYPPIRAGSVRGDCDGNLWILPTTSAQSKAGELVYDVVNIRGELFQRVRVPVGRSIIGFGPRGVVYLMSGDLRSGFALERTHVPGR